MRKNIYVNVRSILLDTMDGVNKLLFALPQSLFIKEIEHLPSLRDEIGSIVHLYQKLFEAFGTHEMDFSSYEEPSLKVDEPSVLSKELSILKERFEVIVLDAFMQDKIGICYPVLGTNDRIQVKGEMLQVLYYTHNEIVHVCMRIHHRLIMEQASEYWPEQLNTLFTNKELVK